LKESPFEEMFLRLIVNLIMLKNSGIPPLAVIPTVLILLLAFVLSLGGYRAFASGNMTSEMTSESPSTPITTTNPEKTPPRSCDDWWSPSSGLLPDCPTKDNESSKDFKESKASDGTVIRTTVYPSGEKEVEKTTPDGTNTVVRSKGGETLSYIIRLKNPNEETSTDIVDKASEPFVSLPSSEEVILEKKPDGYYGKQEDGTKITFYRDPITGRPSSDNWVTETKATDGKVTTVYRNNDRSFNVVTKNPDGTNSTVIEKPDGTTIIKATDSRGITKTTNPDGTWYLTYPRSPDGSMKIYYSDGRTVIKKADGTLVPQ
jgi:hypothetical protein